MPEEAPEVWVVEGSVFMQDYALAFRDLGLRVKRVVREYAERAGLDGPAPSFVLDFNLGAPTFRAITGRGIPVAGVALDHWYFYPRHRYRASDLESCRRFRLPAWNPPIDWQFPDPAEKHPRLYVFTCQPEQVPEYQSVGVRHAEFLPFGVNPVRFRPLPSEGLAPFAAPVSFAGTALRDNKIDGVVRIRTCLQQARAEAASPAEAAHCGVLLGMLEEAVARQDADPFRWRLPRVLEDLERERGVDFLFPGGMTPEKETWALLMGVHLAMRQRLAVVQRLTPLGLAVWGSEDWKQVAGIDYRGLADWETRLASVFNASQVNVNSSKTMFPSGLAPRVLEVLACGGFLLSSRNPVLESFFADGEDLVFYDSLDDLEAKARAWLARPEDRRRIGRQGMAKVRSLHTWTHRAWRILEVLVQSGALPERTLDLRAPSAAV